MDEIETLTFQDVEERNEAVAIVRARPGVVAIALSQQAGSDVECFLPVQAAEQLLKALAEALSVAKRG